MLFICTGDNIPDNWTFDYDCPESGLSPKELAQKAINIIYENRDTDISIKTFSPMMIELMDVIVEYCLKETNRYFLDNKEVSPDVLYIIYDYLAIVYNTVDRIRLASHRSNYDKEQLLNLFERE